MVSSAKLRVIISNKLHICFLARRHSPHVTKMTARYLIQLKCAKERDCQGKIDREEARHMISRIK